MTSWSSVADHALWWNCYHPLFPELCETFPFRATRDFIEISSRYSIAWLVNATYLLAYLTEYLNVLCGAALACLNTLKDITKGPRPMAVAPRNKDGEGARHFVRYSAAGERVEKVSDLRQRLESYIYYY